MRLHFLTVRPPLDSPRVGLPQRAVPTSDGDSTGSPHERQEELERNYLAQRPASESSGFLAIVLCTVSALPCFSAHFDAARSMHRAIHSIGLPLVERILSSRLDVPPCAAASFPHRLLENR